MVRHDCGRRVSWEGEDYFRGVFAGVGFEGHGREGGGFAWFHGYAAEVDCAAEGALDGGFQEVELAHGDAAGGDYYVYLAHGGAKSFF